MDDIPQIQIKATVQQLQISPPPKVLRKAMQYLRQLHLQMQNMANVHPAAPAICLHFAYIRKRKEFPRDEVMQRVGLRDVEYTAQFQVLKARLKLDLSLPIVHLAMKYKCANIKQMAKDNYDTFKTRFEAKLRDDEKRFVKWGDEYPVATLVLTAQKQKQKFDLVTILKDTNVSRADYEEARTRILSLCSDVFGDCLTMGANAGQALKRSKENDAILAEMMAEEANGEPDKKGSGAASAKTKSTTGRVAPQQRKRKVTAPPPQQHISEAAPPASTVPVSGATRDDALTVRREVMRDKIKEQQEKEKKRTLKKLDSIKKTQKTTTAGTKRKLKQITLSSHFVKNLNKVHKDSPSKMLDETNMLSSVVTAGKSTVVELE